MTKCHDHHLFRRGFSLDRRSLALFRIILGLVLLIDLSMNFFYAKELYTRDGLLPRTVWASFYEHYNIWSLHTLLDSLSFIRLLLGAQIALAVALIFGYHTRLASCLSWLLFVSMTNRNLIATDGGDQIASYLLFISMFLPMASQWSVDKWRQRRTHPESMSFYGAGSIMLIVQMTVLYVFAGIAKLMVVDWHDGSAMDLILRWNEYAKPMAESFRASATLSQWVTLATPWLECFGPIAFFIHDRRGYLRILAALGFVGLHLAIDMSLALSLFSFYPMAGLAALLPASFWTSQLCTKLITRFGRLKPSVYISTSVPMKPTTPSPQTRVVKWAGIFIACCSIYTAFPAVFGQDRIPYPQWMQDINDLTFGWQNWNLFRQPPHRSGWYRACGVTGAGNAIDILAANAETSAVPYNTAKPLEPAAQIPSRRWRSFLMRAHTLWDQPVLRQATARILAENWNEKLKQNRQFTDPQSLLQTVTIFYFVERHVPFGINAFESSYIYASWPENNETHTPAACL